MKAYEKIDILLHQSHCSIVPENTALLFPNLLHFIFPKSLYFFFLFTSTPRVDYSNYLDDLISGYSKGEKLSVTFRKIKRKGFRGTQRGLGVRFGTIYKEGKQNNGRSALSEIKRHNLHQTVSPRKLAIYLTNKNYNKILTPDEVDWFGKLREKNPLVSELWTLSERFRKMFEENSIIMFREWVDQVMHSSFNSLKSFVKGLIRDFEAVKAAILNKGNNGQTEGM